MTSELQAMRIFTQNGKKERKQKYSKIKEVLINKIQKHYTTASGSGQCFKLWIGVKSLALIGIKVLCWNRHHHSFT